MAKLWDTVGYLSMNTILASTIISVTVGIPSGYTTN